MTITLRLSLFITACLFWGTISCKKLTDEHNAISNPALTKTLMEVIEANPDLSTFAAYLKQTGYDKELKASKSRTVFAPVNSRFASVDPSILKDSAKLKKLVGNHICSGIYTTTSVSALARIQMLNGKYNNMQVSNIENIAISGPDKLASNGVVHLVDGVLPALDNCWELMANNALVPAKQKDFVVSLFKNVFDPTNAVQVGIDPNTGEPIYQKGTDSVFTNLFWNSVHDLRDEKKQFTYFILTDTAWESEVNNYKPYFSTTTSDSTLLAASWNVVKDFAVDTVYSPTTIPDTILSKSGTKVGIDKLAIVKTIKTSNGIVYIMSKLNVQPLQKFKPIIIQAERYSGTSIDRRNNTYFRDRFNTLTSADFSDVLVLGHGVAQFNIRYRINEMPAIKYKAYWVAVNDFQIASHSQKLAIGDPSSATFAYTVVTPLNYTEVLIGEFTNARYWPLYNIYLVAANSTAVEANPIVCDYIKLVPSL